MTHPRKIMYAEVREEVVLASEVATLLEELIAKHRFLTEHQCGEQFITCSISVSCSYESTIILDPLMETVVPKTLTGEVAVAITSDSHLEPKVELNSPPPPSFTLLKAPRFLIHQRKVLPSGSTS